MFTFAFFRLLYVSGTKLETQLKVRTFIGFRASTSEKASCDANHKHRKKNILWHEAYWLLFAATDFICFPQKRKSSPKKTIQLHGETWVKITCEIYGAWSHTAYTLLKCYWCNGAQLRCGVPLPLHNLLKLMSLFNVFIVYFMPRNLSHCT